MSVTDPSDKRLTRSVEAVHRIRDCLIDLTYPPGSTFTEAEVATQIGMTKTPVREALVVLVHEELVLTKPGAGYLVMPVTLRDVRSACAHWRRLSPDAAARAATRGLDSTGAFMLAEMLQGSESDASRVVRRHTHFYISLTLAAGDDWLLRDFDRLGIDLERQIILALGPDTADHPMAGWQDSHRTLLHLLDNGDADGARAFVLDHIADVESRVIDALMNSSALLSANLGLRGS